MEINEITLFDDGAPHVIATGLNDESVACVSQTGSILWTDVLNTTFHTWASTGWLDSESLQAILFTNGTYGMHGLIKDGEGVFVNAISYPGLPPEISGTRCAIGDVGGDGFMEAVNAGAGQVWCFNHNGTLIDNYPTPSYSRDVTLSAPVLGDVDGDGSIDIVVATSEGNIEAYGKDGTMVEGFPLSTGSSTAIPPVLFDFDGDGDLEMAAASERGFLFVWDFQAPYSEESVPWGGYRHDPANTGMNPQRLQPPAPDDDWMPAHLAYNYPNPTTGNFTTIRYRLEEPADVWIAVYDLAGELVDEFEGPGVGQTENEVVWSLDGVASGIYFCRIRAEGNEGTRTAVIKIAVAK